MADAPVEAFGVAEEFAEGLTGGEFFPGEVLAGGLVDGGEAGGDVVAVVGELEVHGGGAHGFVAGELPGLIGEDVGEEAGEVGGVAGELVGAVAEVEVSGVVIVLVEDVSDDGLGLGGGRHGAPEDLATGLGFGGRFGETRILDRGAHNAYRRA